MTDVNGVYFIKGLPAGTYSVTFDIPSFQAANTDNITLTVGGPRFGQAVNDNQFPQPIPGQNGGRLFRMALGVRF